MGEQGEGEERPHKAGDDETRSWSAGGSSDPSDTPKPGALLGGRFRLLSELGLGGSGRVFAANDTSVQQMVAVKVFHAEVVDERARERLRREVRAARPGHPNAVTVFELHDLAGRPVLSMELVEGTSLRELLAERDRLAVPEATALVRQVADALAHFHRRGLIHRDVKPGNILVTPDGVAKLCDMGLMRPLEHGLTVTATATVVGTPAYMAPEQARGEELTAATDVYALGLTLYQCLTGEIPQVESTAVATALRRQREPAPRLRRECPWCPPWLDRLVRQMLDRDPSRRPTAAEVVASLASGRVRRRVRWRRVAAAGAVVLAGGVAAVAIHTLEAGRAVRMEVAESAIRSVDARGATTWQVELPAAPSQVLRADLTGDGEPELVAAINLVNRPDERSAPPPPSEIIAVTLAGRVVTRVQPRTLIHKWEYPYPVYLVPLLKAIDIDGDGRPELVVVCRQVHFYPNAVLVYWPRWDLWEDLLHHSGYIMEVAAGASPYTLRLLGVNNRLAMTAVIGEVAVTPPHGSSALLEQVSLLSPENGLYGTDTGRWQLYVPMGQVPLAGPFRLRVAPDGGWLATSGADERRFDAFGNPWDGPNRGSDLRTLRMWFLRQVSTIRDGYITPTAVDVAALHSQIETRAAPLLEEPPYAAILAVKTARRLAQVGDLAGGLAVLASAPRSVMQFDDPRYRLAHLQALSGRLQEALKTTDDLFRTGITSRASFDSTVLALRIAIEARNRRFAELEVSRISDQGALKPSFPGVETTLWARVHLWWDEPTELDTRVVSWPLAPAGSALACLARWRLGRTLPGDPEAMTHAAADNPDAATEAKLAAAAAELALGRPRDALAGLEAVASALEPLAGDDFEEHQLLDLCRALHVRALVAAGEGRRALTEAAHVRPALTPDLLPAHLVDEALHGAHEVVVDEPVPRPPQTDPRPSPEPSTL